MNPITLLLTGRRTPATPVAPIDLYLSKLLEPLPATWLSDWRLGDTVEFTRPTQSQDYDWLEFQPGRVAEIKFIDINGEMVVTKKPICVLVSYSYGPQLSVLLHQWVHPNAIRLIQRGNGLTGTEGIEQFAQLLAKDNYNERE